MGMVDHLVRAVIDVTGSLGRRVACLAPGVGDGVASGAAGLGDGVAGLGQVLADRLGLSGERASGDQADSEHSETVGHAVLLRRTDRRSGVGFRQSICDRPNHIKRAE
jgi:hypothetical protein